MARKPPQNHKKPTSSNPWDRPPTLPSGNDSVDPIYRAVGHALSRWEYLECALASLFAHLCQSKQSAAELAYGSAMAFSARRDMLMAASESYFYFMPDAHKEFEKLINQIGKLNGRRNDLALGIVMHFGGAYGDGWYLAPPHYNFAKSKFMIGRDHSYQYTSDQIDVIRSKFDDYRVETMIMLKRLHALRSSWHEKHLEPLHEPENPELLLETNPRFLEPQQQTSDPSSQSDGKD